MEVIKLRPNGFCKGVIRAVQIINQTVKQYPKEKIYVLGMLVHNRYLCQALELSNVITLDTTTKSIEDYLKEISQGIVVFTAHGTNEKLIQLAKDKGLITVDATCLDVIKTRELVKNRLEQGYEIIYLGKENHPEANAICSIDTQHIHLVNNLSAIDDLTIKSKKIYLTNQTTMSIIEIATWIKKIQSKYPEVIVEEEICNATRMRQQAVISLKDVEALFIVGDPLSNNTRKLALLAKDTGIDIFPIQNVNDITVEMLKYHKVGLTAGASTPSYIANQVATYLTNPEVKPEFSYQELNESLMNF